MNINDDTWITTNVTQSFRQMKRMRVRQSYAVVGGAFVITSTIFSRVVMVKDRSYRGMFAPGVVS